MSYSNASWYQCRTRATEGRGNCCTQVETALQVVSPDFDATVAPSPAFHSRHRFSRKRYRVTPRPASPSMQASNAARMMALVALIPVCVFVLGVVMCVADVVGSAFNPTELVAFATDNSTTVDLPISTPKEQWRQGKTPYLYQKDAAWSSYSYANDTVGVSGCGPTALTMAYVALTGKTDMTPADMCDFSTRENCVTDGATEWSLIHTASSKLGLKATELPPTIEAVQEALRANKLIIASMKPGDFTQVGHFIVLTDIVRGNSVLIRDPNSVERSNQTWEITRILNQCANLWALEAT